jgi:hypothetical protein
MNHLADNRSAPLDLKLLFGKQSEVECEEEEQQEKADDDDDAVDATS